MFGSWYLRNNKQHDDSLRGKYKAKNIIYGTVLAINQLHSAWESEVKDRWTTNTSNIMRIEGNLNEQWLSILTDQWRYNGHATLIPQKFI